MPVPMAAEHHVLRRTDHGRAVGGREDVARRHHEDIGLRLGLDRQGQVHGHLVTVEVGVESLADQRVQHDGVALDQHRLKGLDAHAVKGGGTVQEHRMLVDDLFQDVPHLILSRSIIRLALLMVSAYPCCLSRE